MLNTKRKMRQWNKPTCTSTTVIDTLLEKGKLEKIKKN